MKNLNALLESSKENNPALYNIIMAILDNTNSLEFISTNIRIVADAASEDLAERERLRELYRLRNLPPDGLRIKK